MCKNLVELLTTEKKAPVVPPVIPATVIAPQFTPEVHKLPLASIEGHDFVAKAPETADERHWTGSNSSSKYREYGNDWESTSYNSHSRSSSSKLEEDYKRGSGKYYDKYGSRRERSREYSGKYGHHSSYRDDDYERDRHKKDRDRDSDRRDRDRSDRSRKDRSYYEYKDKHRYGYSKSYSKTDSYRTETPNEEYPAFDSYNSAGGASAYGYNYPYPATSSSSWAPPPPTALPENSPPRPPPEPPNDGEIDLDALLGSSRVDGKINDDGENTVDLDTRIAMLFKSKSFNSDMPSSLQLEEESDKETNLNEEVVVATESSEVYKRTDDNIEFTTSNWKQSFNLKSMSINDELKSNEDVVMESIKETTSPSDCSTIPSPFESRNSYRCYRKFTKSRKRKSQNEGIKVESGASDISSSEDELLAKGSYSPPLLKVKDENEMSLSSLSSTEGLKDDITPQKGTTESVGNYPVAFSTYNAAYYYQNSLHQFQQPNHWISGSGYSHVKKESRKDVTNDPHETAVKKVIEKLIQELKQILKKDFNKRMIENTAFKKYEAWWDDQERNKNDRLSHREPVEAIPALTSSAATLENYQARGGLGILRNLRFQRIKRDPAPLAQEEDSRKSDPDDDDMVHGSDSEKEDIQQSAKTSYIKRNLSASSSSESSESDDTSSEDDDEEEEREDQAYSSDTASIMSDDELVAIRKPAEKKEKEINRIYSDSDSDTEEAEAQKTPTKLTTKIYSDSEEEQKPAAPPEPVKEEKPDEPPPKTPEKQPEQAPQPAESDSDFFNDDIISKPPRTPGRTSSEEQAEKEPEKSVAEPVVKVADTNDRMYSDSEEEREYQEKIRRNTEWMEQIEREAKEEIERQRLLQSHRKDSDVSTDVNRESSPVSMKTPKLDIKKSIFDERFDSATSPPPQTPGANIKSDSKLSQDYGKRKRGRPKGSIGKTKEQKKVKNGSTGKLAVSIFAQPHPSMKSEAEQNYTLKLSPLSSSDGGSSLVALEHCYSLPPSATPSSSSSPHDHQDIHMDHDYCGKAEVTPLQSIQPNQLNEQIKKEQGTARPVGRPKKDPNAPKAQYIKKDRNVLVEKKSPKEKLKKFDYKQHQAMVESFQPVPRYNKRTSSEEFDILCRFLTQGIDQEDVDYMRQSYSYLIQNDFPATELLHQVHWVDHCATDRSFAPVPTKKRRRDDLPEMKQHVTGCARTEGYYKIDSKDKAHYKYHHLRGTAAGSHLDNSAKMAVAKMQNASREARSNQRRLLTAFGGATESDLLKFNQLKFRNKQLKFAKSAIHDWGLFAMEPIAADEMVIEYVGQMVRPSVADLRETKYEAIGIGSSYLFRIDMETIIDATKCGNLARFINHSCNVSGDSKRNLNNLLTSTFILAELLCESNHNRVGKEDCHLLQAGDWRERGDHLRLQIPTRGREDSLPMWCSRMSWNIKLISERKTLFNRNKKIHSLK